VATDESVVLSAVRHAAAAPARKIFPCSQRTGLNATRSFAFRASAKLAAGFRAAL
jgi:hypothetical protein